MTPRDAGAASTEKPRGEWTPPGGRKFLAFVVFLLFALADATILPRLDLPLVLYGCGGYGLFNVVAKNFDLKRR